jgi:hypothetical protein
MNWEQLLNQQRNEAITSRFPPYILDYQVEGETVSEFYHPKTKESVLEVPQPRRRRRNT